MKWIIATAAATCLALAGCSRQEAGWRQAERADTVTAYEDYLGAYPAGPHAARARARIAELRDDDDWARADRLAAPEAWQRYLATHPEGRHADLARRRLAAFVPAAGAPGWSVQLGAYSTESAAQGDLVRLAREQGPLFHGLRWRILEPTAAAFWRLRAGPLDEAAARRLCAELAARSLSCVPVAEPISP